MNMSEMDAMFDREGDRVTVKPGLRQDITWRLGDASSPGLVQALGAQDLVVANRFLCHMEPTTAERCLRNLSALVKPGGYIFVSGVDLDVRTKVAKELRWKPVLELIQEIHEGDFSLAKGWPLQWWGLEPFCKDHPDWRIRYACAFKVGEAFFNQDGATAHLMESLN
jgi:Methyltransferase domain